MATIATLSAKISADGANFSKVMDSVDKKLKKTEESSKSLNKTLKAIKAFTIAYAGAAAASVTGGVLSKAVDDLNIARTIDEDVSAIRGLQQSLRDVGKPAEQAGEVLQGLAQTLARGSVGDRGIRTAIRGIGLDVNELNAMRPSEALAKIADAISGISDPTRRAAVATQLFGDKALTVLPLLTQGSSALADGAARAKAFGNALSNVDATNIETARIQLENIKTVIEGVIVQIGVQLLPLILAIGEEFGSIQGSAYGVAGAVRVVVEVIGTVGAVVNEIGKVFKIFFKFVALGWLGLAGSIIYGINKIAEQLAKLPEEVGGKFFKGVVEDNNQLMQRIKGDIDDIGQSIDSNIAGMGDSFTRLGEFLGNADARAEKLKQGIMNVRDAGKAVAPAFKLGEHFKEGLNAINQARTPLQKFQDEMTNIQSLFAKGALGDGAEAWETYSRTVANAVAELEKAHELQSLALPSAQLGNTSGAASAISKAEMQERRQLEKPEDRVRRVLEQSQKIEERQLEIQRKIADAVGKQTVVRF